MNRIRIHRPLLLLSALILAALGCGLPSGSGPAPTPGPPATPAIFLPPEWTPTPAPPTPDVPADWQEFEGGRVHLWLPGSFEGGDMGAKFQAILETLRTLGPEFAQTVQVLEQNPDVFVLWAFDPQPGPTGSITNVNVTRVDVPEATTIDDYLDVSIELLPSSFEVIDRGIVNVGDYDMGKLVLSSNVQGLRGMSVVYSFRDGNQFWNVTYSTGADEFVTRSPAWGRSISTLRMGD